RSPRRPRAVAMRPTASSSSASSTGATSAGASYSDSAFPYPTDAGSEPACRPPPRTPSRMPELPEAETIVRDLARRTSGASITGARVARPDLLAHGLTPRALDSALRDRPISRVFRRGKNIVVELGPAAAGGSTAHRKARRAASGLALPDPADPAWLVVNLGMT